MSQLLLEDWLLLACGCLPLVLGIAHFRGGYAKIPSSLLGYSAGS